MRLLARPNRVALERRRKAMLIGISYDPAPVHGIQRLKVPQRDTQRVCRLLKGEVSNSG